jgi:hypothetical protein
MQAGHSLSLDLRCLLCKEVIEDEKNNASITMQIERLNPECGFGLNNPCLVCRQFLPDSKIKSRSYKVRFEKHVAHLRQLKAERDKRRAEMEADREWPSDTKSLVGRIFTGECPACLKAGMAAVTGDFYECPECRLQLHLSGGARILPQKGLAEFKTHGNRLSATENFEGLSGVEIVEDMRVS